MARSRQKKPKQPNPEWLAGTHLVRADRLLGRIATGGWPYAVGVRDAQHDVRIPKGEWAVVTPDGEILCNTGIRGSAQEWAYAIAHCVLHLCFDHFRPHPDERAWNFGCDAVVSRFLAASGLGTPPPPHMIDFPPLPRDEEAIYRELTLRGGIPENYRPDLLLFEGSRRDDYEDPIDYPMLFAAALQEAVGEAMRIASGVEPHADSKRADSRSLSNQARSWFMASYPLLGALAASFELIEDLDACRALDIEIAAVCAADKTIFVNPLAGLDLDEMKFVVAHEILHAALRHDERVESRDFFLWNCATDYTINLWLVEMCIGRPPYGLLLDEQLRGMSSEEVYDRITGDLRIQRRLRRAASFAGRGKPDMVEESPRSGGFAAPAARSTTSIAAPSLRASTCISVRAVGFSRRVWSKRSVPRRCRRFRGTSGSPNGSTSSSRFRSTAAATRGTPAGSLRRRTFRGRAPSPRRAGRTAGRSAWFSTPRVRWMPSLSPAVSVLSRPTARRERCPRSASSSATRRHMTPGI